MKFLHISDLHIGKKFREADFTEDQIYILDEIIRIAEEEKPDGILIAGDIYDRSIPPATAVNIFDDFLTKLNMRGIKVFAISGNHDSPERLNFGKLIMGKNEVYIAGSFKGDMDKVTLEDEYGILNVYLLPYIKPSSVSNFYKDIDIDNYETAAKVVINEANIDNKNRNILIAHQFITNAGMQPDQSESEIINIGGLDNIDVSVFDDFDYVALGHIHGPQKIGRDTVRYSGTPLKYSFSECNHNKSVTCIEIKEKGNIDLKFIPLNPIRNMRVIRDTLDHMLYDPKYIGQNTEDYIHAIITDEEDIYDPIGKLRTVYKNILLLEVENTKTKINEYSRTSASGDVATRSPMELFREFYLNQNNVDLNENQIKLLSDIFEEIGGEEL